MIFNVELRDNGDGVFDVALTTQTGPYTKNLIAGLFDNNSDAGFYVPVVDLAYKPTQDVAPPLLSSTETFFGSTVAIVVPPTEITYIGSNSGAATGTTHVFTAPAGSQAGDVLLLHVATPYASNNTYSCSGFTSIQDVPNSDITHGAVLRKVMTASEPANYTLTISASVATGWIVSAYRGVDPTTPIDVSAASVNGQTTTISCPSVTPTADGDMLVMSGHQGFSAETLTAPSGMTLAGQVNTGVGLASAYLLLTSTAATGAKTFGGNSGANENVGITVALKAAPGGAGGLTLVTSLYSNGQTFYGPAVTVGPVGLSPSLVTNAQTVYTPTVGASSPSQGLTAPLLTNSQTVYSSTVSVGAVGMTAPLLTNTSVFYGATAAVGSAPTQGLTAPLTSNAQAFYAATASVGAVGLTAPLLTNAQTFYAGTVSVGAVGLSPTLLTNAQTFYAGTVLQGGVVVQPPWVVNAATLYGASITPGAVTLAPSFVTSGVSFYAPSVGQFSAGQSLTPPLVTNEQTVYSSTVGVGVVQVSSPFVANAQAFYAPSLATGAVTLNPALLQNSAAIYAPTLFAGGSGIYPPLLDSTTSLFAGTVAPGAVTLIPSLYSNDPAYFGADVTTTATLSAPLLANDEAFYAASVGVGSAGLYPPTLGSTETLFEPSIAAGVITLDPPFIAGTVVFSPATTTTTYSTSASRIESSETVYPATVAPGSVDIAPVLLQNFESFFGAYAFDPGSAYHINPPLVPSEAVIFDAAITEVTLLDKIYKLLANRQELDPVSGQFVVYDDDSSTVLFHAPAWENPEGTIPYSGKALRRIDRLT